MKKRLTALICVFALILSMAPNFSVPVMGATASYKWGIPSFSGMTFDGGDEYLSGNVGVQKTSNVSWTLTNDSLEVTTTGQYSGINILTGTGTNSGGDTWYATNGFKPTGGNTYRLTAVVSSQNNASVRIVGNNDKSAAVYGPQETLSTTPRIITFEWTQGDATTGGNLRLDNGTYNDNCSFTIHSLLIEDISNLPQPWGIPNFSGMTFDGGDEYLSGNVGVQKTSNVSWTLTNDSLEVTTTGQYSGINILTGTGTNSGGDTWYATNGFKPTGGNTYRLTAVVSSPNDASVRIVGNNDKSAAVYGPQETLSTTPRIITFEWTQGDATTGGNLRLDNGTYNDNCSFTIHSLLIWEFAGTPPPTTPTTPPAGSTKIYELFVTPDASLPMGGSAFTGSDWLQDAGASLQVVPNGAGSSIQVTKGDPTQGWQGLDVKAGLEVGAEYWVKVTGRTNSDYTSGSMQLQNAGDSTIVSDTPQVGSFTLLSQFTATHAGRLRINTSGSSAGAIFFVDTIEIYRTKDAPPKQPTVTMDDIFITFDPNDPDDKKWADRFYANGDGVTIAPVTGAGVGNSDDHALKVTRTGSDTDNSYKRWVRFGHIAQYAQGADQPLNLPMNCDYDISAYVYIPPFSADLTMQITINNTAPNSSEIPLNAGSWTKVSFIAEMPLNTPLDSITFRINKLDSTFPAEWYIDHVSVKQILTNTEPPDFHTYTPLKDLYKDYFLIGTTSHGSNMKDAKLDIISYHFNSFTPENEMKPSYMNSDGTNNTGRTALNEIFGKLPGYKLIGHTLVWHSQSPNNPVPGSDRAAAQANMQDLIGKVMKDYAAQLYSMDVANEVMRDGLSIADAADWRSCVRTNDNEWFKSYGNTDYIYDAFVFARAEANKYNPSLLLYYNDYNLDNRAKATAVRNMVKELNERWQAEGNSGNLIQGIGMQSHNSLSTAPANVEASIRMFAELGVLVSISELDITINGTNQTNRPTPEQYKQQAVLYAELFEIYMKYATGPANTSGNPKVIERVTFWGTNDADSWRAYGGQGGNGGYPLLFDKDLRAKPAFLALLNPSQYIANNKPAPPDLSAFPHAYAVKGSPAIGANDALWAATETFSVSKKAVGSSNNTGLAQVMWDDNYLYVRVNVTDDNVDVTANNDWQKDSVEVFVSEIGARQLGYDETQGNQFRVTANGLQSAKSTAVGWPTSSTAANPAYAHAEVTATGYLVEMKIPMALAIENQTIGFDIQINDPPPATDSRPQITWSDPSANGYNTSENWGRVTLVTSLPGNTPPPPSDSDNRTSAEQPSGTTDGSNVQWDFNKTPDDSDKNNNPSLKRTPGSNKTYRVLSPMHSPGTVVTAQKSEIIVIINGQKTTLPALNINGFNYLKLRDIAFLLNATSKQFSIEYDEKLDTIKLLTDNPYEPVGDELDDNIDSDAPQVIASPQKLRFNGKLVRLTAYNYNGYNYFRLRDLAILLDFNLIYDEETGAITMDFDNPYSE